MKNIIATSILLALSSNVCLADPKYVPQLNYNKSDLDRAMEQVQKDARKDPPYTPPNPHEGRIKIPGTDYSVGGKTEPPTVDVKTTY